MTPTTLNTLGDSLKKQVQEFVLIEPSEDNEFQVIAAAQLAEFKATKTEMVTAVKALKIISPEDFAMAGDMVTGCDAIIAAIENRFNEPTVKANKKHKALTKAWGEADKEFVEAVAFLKGARAGYKAAVEAEEKRKAAEVQRLAREAAEAKQREEAEAARVEAKRIADLAAEEKRLTDEAAAEQTRLDREAAEAAALAAAEIVDPDEAMAAAAEAAELAERAEADRIERERIAAEQEQERQRQVEEAARRAEQAAAAPVVIQRVVVEPAIAKEEGVTWAEKWEVEYPMNEDGTKINEEPVLRAILSEIGKRPDLIGYLKLNIPAINSAGRNQKNLANIPGVRVWNNNQEKRSRK